MGIEEAGAGPMPMAITVRIVKISRSPAYHEAVPLGSVYEFWVRIGDREQTVPEGWAIADGSYRRRKDYPEVAPRMRQFTSWMRWHLGREFKLPTLPVSVGVDFG